MDEDVILLKEKLALLVTRFSNFTLRTFCSFFLFIFFPLTALIGCGAIELFLAQLWVWGSLQTPQGDGSCNDF